VGYPAPGVEIALFGEDGSPVADGEVGEIAVGSRYLAARYLGAAKLTAERFLELGDGHRVYLTGDLGRTGPFGRLEYLGRLDGTCKVGGVRVEPAEVEAALLALDGVTDAAVTVEGSPRGQGRFVARVVTRPRGPTSGAYGARCAGPCRPS
jgi:acyl-coenzyme A synthetase/AMP-(fatty) acid ligase